MNSKYAQQKGLPRDVVVQLILRKMRDDIISKHFKHPLEIEGRAVKIMKELPKKVLQSRKEYGVLTEKLKEGRIRSCWEIAEGRSFLYKGKRLTINNQEQMRRFIENSEDFGKKAESKNAD